ncbi:FAD-dependent oxidoreductase [Geomicrobium sediminis]|uniref:2-polyprenyl-6-methoxyphenol hydroxylase-like FAD-dependent oxidoreductase n=1 Tax=Geomicrobium sediminis TaxID=1347788 RepID=A0ABS2P8W6_9BACL|nr:FAD dependent oxidoreductase [Geomicrobium sediminis]MBM7631850.1 2-polyprenyl-6-methoxyphenol hydroxylase-like FAD-dependent oxidoreductase [Geomicrobium sediminis]
MKKNTAIVIGSSIAGIFATNVLAPVYEEVIVIDRDRLPKEAKNRPGTPQSFHIHRLLPKGIEVMNRYFPGFIQEMIDQGAFHSSSFPGYIDNPFGSMEIPAAMEDAGASRALLESTLRRRVKKHRNVTWMEQVNVIGLTTTNGHQTITGVRGEDRLTRKELHITGDLVIDVSGISTKLPQWLSDLNLSPPTPEKLMTNIGYTTRYYSYPRKGDSPTYSDIISHGNSGEQVGSGLLSHQENGRAGIILYFAGGARYPSTDEEAFENEINELQSSKIAEISESFVPESAPRGYRIKECVRQHYECADVWPEGLLALGDAFCNFDPLFGQGISVAAMEAEVLDECLKVQTSHWTKHVFEQMQQRVIAPAWWTSGLSDLQWSGVHYVGDGELNDPTFAHNYLRHYLSYAFEEKENGNTKPIEGYLAMIGLLEPLTSVFNATTALKLAERSDEFAGYKTKDETWEHVISTALPT